MGSTILLVVGICAMLPFAINAQQSCQVGWEGPSPLGKCYRIMSRTGTPWSDADQLCKSVGATLANIETNQEDAFITSRIIPSATDWLITGGRRQPVGTSGAWTWSDGSAFTYANWGSPGGLPGGDATNDYLYIYSHPLHKGTANYGKWWADRPVTHQVLCQIKDPNYPPNNSNSCGCNRCGC